MTQPCKQDASFRAIADGLQMQKCSDGEWSDCSTREALHTIAYGYEVRIKPEPKPDFVQYASAHRSDGCQSFSWGQAKTRRSVDNLKLTFDGETGRLKAVEIVG
jgi:hypothetical protein